MEHEGGFKFAGVADELVVAFEDSRLGEVENIPVTTGGDEGVGKGELEFSGYDSHGVDVAAVSVEEEEAFEVVFKKALSQAEEDVLIGVEGCVQSSTESKVVGTGSGPDGWGDHDLVGESGFECLGHGCAENVVRACGHVRTMLFDGSNGNDDESFLPVDVAESGGGHFFEFHVLGWFCRIC